MNIEHPDTSENFAEQLRAVAPVLPAALKTRTLARCAAQVQSEQRRRQRGSKRLIWSLAGLCLFQWLVASLLDSQHVALLMSSPTRSPHYADISVRKNPSADVWSTLQARSQTLAGLMANRDEWVTSPESG